MTPSLPGTILITGSNGSLGARLVSDFLDAGVDRIACHYRSSSERISSVLRKRGRDAAQHVFQAELTEERQVQALRHAVEERLGPVWGIVNLAGGSTNSMVWKLSLEAFYRVLNDNLLSTFVVTREFLPGMRERGAGRIVNISSIVAHTGVPGASHYCAAKAAIEGFTKAVALETAPKGITVNCIALGYFDQGIINQVPAGVLEGIVDRIPLKRLGRASELYPLLAYLLSPESDFMTGQVLHLNGGHYS
jgi:NAD(P)-dependent dehydrogenase (short-subunit alcohol dehydrogenase family)